MKVSVKTPNITQYYLQLETGDELYRRCTWAEIKLDHDTYTMTAMSDCGSYSYRWYPTPQHESFRKLMARLDSDYLLDKIASEYFDFEESREQLLKMVDNEHYVLDDMTRRWLIDDLENMDACGEELFLAKMTENIGWHCSDIPVVSKYPSSAQTFAHIFVEYLQPILREELQSQ